MSNEHQLGEGWGDSVPVVTPSDLRNVSQMLRNVTDQFPDEPGSISAETFVRLCGAGADVEAVWLRASMLEMLFRIMPEMLSTHMQDGQLEDRVIDVAATIPMKNIGVGIPHEGFPFDVDGFAKEIEGR